MIQQTIQPDFDSWRTAARSLLARRVEPVGVMWVAGGEDSLFGAAPATGESTPNGDRSGTEPAPPAEPLPPVPRSFLETARVVACHRDAARWDLLYRILWRLTVGGERRLLDIPVDDDVSRLHAMHRAVRRDRHKMTAFVRFRRVDGVTDRLTLPTPVSEVLRRPGSDLQDDSGLLGVPLRPGVESHKPDREDPEDHYIAWHRPDHLIVRLTTPFFVRRFGAMRWSILTPDESVTWDGVEPRFGPGVPASQAPQADALEDLWRTYYANIFNPARLNVRAMKRELPVRHWATLPETTLLPDLLKDAPRRVEDMVARQRRTSAPVATTGKTPAQRIPASQTNAANCPTATSAAEFVPPSRELPVLAKAAATCRGCQLYCNATQVVFGEGPRDATVMFVGEQPGDQEDRAGKPFVGPAGQLLDTMLEKAGVPREETYVTNAVKHFKFEPRGTRRIHSKPSAREVGACRPWLEAEIEAVRPRMIVCLGATAAQSLMGNTFRVTQSRGVPITDTKWAPWVMATVHPSALLRVPDDAMREQFHAQFLEDMKRVAKQLKVEKKRA